MYMFTPKGWLRGIPGTLYHCNLLWRCGGTGAGFIWARWR